MFHVYPMTCYRSPNDQQRKSVHTTKTPYISHRTSTLQGTPHIRVMAHPVSPNERWAKSVHRTIESPYIPFRCTSMKYVPNGVNFTGPWESIDSDRRNWQVSVDVALVQPCCHSPNDSWEKACTRSFRIRSHQVFTIQRTLHIRVVARRPSCISQ